MPDQGPAQRLPDFSEPAGQHCRRVLAVWIVAALFLLLSMTGAQAQDTSLSAPLSGSIGEPIYSESEQGGPSTSLIPGDTSLTNPYIRTGISDPLNFLIESGLMTPYAPESSLVTSYADTEVPNLVLNDSTVAARFSEYRGNRLLMSGAGNNSLRTGRASSAGTTVTGQSGTQTAEAGFATSDKAGLLAPFAAGSSALAARQSATSTLLDPNAMIAAATSSAYLGGVQGAASNAPASAPGMAAGVSSSSPDLTGDSTTRTASPVSSMVPPPTNMPSGPAPGDLFPDLTMAVSSGTGFEDSTMDTAGSSYETGDVSISPLLSPHSAASDSPFAQVSSGTRSFLNPTLRVAVPWMTGEAPVSLSEMRRKARMHALIYNPGASLPTPFEQRKMERQYLRKNTGRRASRYPDLTAPSIKP